MKKLAGVTCAGVILVATICFAKDKLESHSSSEIVATNAVESGLGIPEPLRVDIQMFADSTDKHIKNGSFRHMLKNGSFRHLRAIDKKWEKKSGEKKSLADRCVDRLQAKKNSKRFFLAVIGLCFLLKWIFFGSKNSNGEN